MAGESHDDEALRAQYEASFDGDDDAAEDCWYCHGEGGFHDCGEDCCCCLDKEEITEVCPECHGRGLL